MSGKRSKDKGNRGERELCKILEEYLGGSWVKTSGSGSYVGGKNQSRTEKLDETQIKAFRADIITPEELDSLVIESKNYNDIPFHNFLKPNGVSDIESWIDDLEHDAGDSNYAWLCFKIKRKGWYIGMRKTESVFYEIYNYSVYNSKHGEYVFTCLQDFLKRNANKINEIHRATESL